MHATASFLSTAVLPTEWKQLYLFMKFKSWHDQLLNKASCQGKLGRVYRA